MDFTLLIKNNYSGMSKAHKKIADFIINHPDLILELSAIQIGEKTKTSAASVIRFSKKLGFISLENLKIDIAKNMNEFQETDILDPIISKKDTTEEIISKLSSIVTSTTQILPYQLDSNEVKKAIELIQTAKTVYLYGVGASGLPAYDLYHKLNRANIRAVYNFDTHISLVVSNYTTSEDVVIAFSYSGNTKDILYAVRQAKKNNTKIIVVTRNKKSPLYNLSDVLLTIPNNESLLRIGAISSKYSAMLISDILFLGSIQKNFDLIEKGFQETSIIVQKMKE